MADKQAYLPKVMDGAARQRSYVARQKATNLEAYRAKKAAAEKARRRRRRTEKQAEPSNEEPLSHLASVVAELLGPEERAHQAEVCRQTEKEVHEVTCAYLQKRTKSKKRNTKCC